MSGQFLEGSQLESSNCKGVPREQPGPGLSSSKYQSMSISTDSYRTTDCTESTMESMTNRKAKANDSSKYKGQSTQFPNFTISENASPTLDKLSVDPQILSLTPGQISKRQPMSIEPQSFSLTSWETTKHQPMLQQDNSQSYELLDSNHHTPMQVEDRSHNHELIACNQNVTGTTAAESCLSTRDADRATHSQIIDDPMSTSLDGNQRKHMPVDECDLFSTKQHSQSFIATMNQLDHQMSGQPNSCENVNCRADVKRRIKELRLCEIIITREMTGIKYEIYHEMLKQVEDIKQSYDKSSSHPADCQQDDLNDVFQMETELSNTLLVTKKEMDELGRIVEFRQQEVNKESIKDCNDVVCHINKSQLLGKPEETTQSGHQASLLQKYEEESGDKEDKNSIDLLLIGGSGHGKSATGNSILNKATFKKTSSSSVTSECSRIAKDSTKIGDKIVNVIDGPGISYSDKIQPDQLDKIFKEFYEALEICNYGFTAILLVFKFGNRFTKHEEETIKVIKSMLGPNVIRDYCVCVITQGDNFENAVEEASWNGETLTFDTWVKGQTGCISHLFKECSYRCVLFDNSTKDGEKKRIQVDNLMSIIPQGKRYSRKEFTEEGKKGELELYMISALPSKLENMKVHLEKIREEIRFNERYENDINTYTTKMEPLLTLLSDLDTSLKIYGVGSVDVEGMKLQIKTLKMDINTKMKHREVSEALKQAEKNMSMHLLWSSPLAASATSAVTQQLTGTQTEITGADMLEVNSLTESYKAHIQPDVVTNKDWMLSFQEKLNTLLDKFERKGPSFEWVVKLLRRMKYVINLNKTNM